MKKIPDEIKGQIAYALLFFIVCISIIIPFVIIGLSKG